MKTRKFYEIEEQKIYTLEELKNIYNSLNEDEDFKNQGYKNFDEWLNCATEKNGTLQEIQGNLHLNFDTENIENISIEFSEFKDALKVYNSLLNAENVYDLHLMDSKENLII